jgi:phage tail sheath protein FI
MTQTYQSPGVYVNEVPSGLASIAGVGTSTAGFIGILDPQSASASPSGSSPPTGATLPEAKTPTPLKSANGQDITGSANGQQQNFTFSINPPLGTSKQGYQFFYESEPTTAAPTSLEVDGDTLEIDAAKNTATVKFKTAVPGGKKLLATYTPPTSAPTPPTTNPVTGEVKLCTNFTEFTKAFGQSAQATKPPYLEDAVYGFFRNGGTRCFVTVVNQAGLTAALEDFAAIDEIAIVAAPGCTDRVVLQALSSHCEKLGDRIAIFDGPLETTSLSLKPGEGNLPASSNYAAFYYPWIEVEKDKYVPPSGHIAGVYARVDAQRGVHKAPANEAILGAIGLKYALTRAKQDDLNPQGVNCIRSLNGRILVWGARTWGGKDNNEFKYINTRRLFNYLRESIDEGTQWAVFEPNGPELWAKIRRSVIAFLTMAWRSGALFGNTPEEAFFVQCDEETNPPEVRNVGQLVVKVGVAMTQPAEFVIFELSQWSGGQ